MTIALLTDFGTRDHYVGAMKGVILSINPKATIVDVTHEIEPQNILSAAFTLSACYRDFPSGTIFAAVVDPGVGSNRRAILVENDGYQFVGPDNGIFGFALSGEPVVRSLENDHYFYKPVSSSFHGRDVFAPVAAHLSLGVPAAEFGPEISDPVLPPSTRTVKTGNNTIDGTVIHIDRFGNIVTNITAEEAGQEFELEVGGRSITEQRTTYSDGGSDSLFAIVGSTGLIEISVNGGSAADLVGIRAGTTVTLRRK